MLATFTRRGALAAIALALVAAAADGQEIENRLVIVTSFSKDLTEPYRQAFQKKYPGHQGRGAEPQHRRGRHLHPRDRVEPAGHHVGVGAGRLRGAEEGQAAAEVPARRQRASPARSAPIRSTIRTASIVGFAASGYGIMYNTRYLKANNLPAPKEWDDLKKADLFRPCRNFGAVALRHHASDRRDHPAGRRLGQRLGDAARDRRQSRAGVRPLVRRARCGQQRPVRRRHRHRLLRPVRQGVRLPGRVRLSDA